MVNYYSNKEYESINFILDIFSSDIFEGITWIMRPVVGAVDYLRSMHRLYQVQKELDRFSSLGDDSREKLLDVLTDIVSVDIYDRDLEEISKRIEGKISELDEFNETFKKLTAFTKGLNHSERTALFKLSLRRLNGKIVSIRDEIRSKIWEKNEDSKQLLVLDQMFFLIQELVKETIKKVDHSDLWIQITVSLLMVEAFRRGKITFDGLEDYISDLSLLRIKENSIPRNYNAVFEVLNA